MTHIYIYGFLSNFQLFSCSEEPLKVLLKRAMQKDEKMNHRNLEIKLFSKKFAWPQNAQHPIHA